MSIQLKTKVLFLCTGNICRSPMAQAIFQHKMNQEKQKRGLKQEILSSSAGTGLLQKFQKADERTLKVLKENGIECNHFARNLELDDFIKFDYMLCMDKKNYNTVAQLMKQFKSQYSDKNVPDLQLMRKFDPTHSNSNQDVPDPYFKDLESFQQTFNLLNTSIEGFIKEIIKPLDEKQ